MNLRRSPIYEKLLYYWRRVIAALLLLGIVSLVGLYFIARPGKGPAVSQAIPTEEVMAPTPTVEAKPTSTSAPEPTLTSEPASTPIPEPTPTPEPTSTLIPEPTATPEPVPVAVVIETPAAGQNPPELSGTGPAGTTIRIFDGDTLLGEVVAGADGTWTFTPADSLATGEHTLKAIAVDKAGAEIGASEPLAITVGPGVLPVTGGE